MILGIIVFVAGAVVMVLELTGSRIVAPYVGTSMYVWTSLISVILGSLSLGYFLGGKLADKKPSYQYLSTILLLAAVFICLIVILRSPVFSLLQNTIADIRLRAILSTLLLFSAPSILLGMVSPYAVKLKLHTIKHSASTVGNLYALSTIGSIVGTVLAGFFLIAYLGSTKILLLLTLILVILSIIGYAKSLKVPKLLLFTFAAFLFFRVDYAMAELEKYGYVEKESLYNTIHIVDSIDQKSDQPIRLLRMGRHTHSGKYLNSDELLLEYTKYYDVAFHFNPNIKKTLMIGGGAYVYPQEYLRKYPKNTIDVVEIDPSLQQIARDYFGLTNNPRMKIYHQDGRIFLNESHNTYNAIFLDAYGLDHIPFHVTTSEAIKRMYDLLSPGGIVVTNIVSSLDGKNSLFLSSQYRTYKEIFPHVYIFPVRSNRDVHMQQNIMLVAIKSNREVTFPSTDSQLNSYLEKQWEPKKNNDDAIVLTDDFSPVELYTLELN